MHHSDYAARSSSVPPAPQSYNSKNLASFLRGAERVYDCNDEGGIPEESIGPVVPEVKLSPDQSHILEAVKRGENVFFTGPAGTGKSVLLRAIIKELLETKSLEAIAVTATTGIAALAIGGQTLHSYAGIRTGSEVVEILVRRIKRARVVKERWKRTQVWIIDEVSMLKAELFDKLEYIARVVRQDSRPFGGIQLVLAGDFFQLPPVHAKGSPAPPDFVFGANTWRACIPHPYFLREVFRQKDDAFIDILSSMRLGSLNQQQITMLKGLERPLSGGTVDVQPALLLPRRRDVDGRNKRELERLQGPAKTYFSMDSAGWNVYREPISPEKAKEIMNMAILAPEKLTLKIGAQVMLIQNVIQGELVNGSMGKVVDFMTVHEAREKNIPISAPSNNDEDEDDLKTYDGLDYDEDDNLKSPPMQPPPYQHRTYIEEHILDCYSADPTIAKRQTQLRDITGHAFPPNKEYPVVHFTNESQLLCVPVYFDRVGLMGNIEARRVQVPLILSWAITIHKSQGQTLDLVKVDFEGIFADGQAYVAVSRATSMDGLQLVNFQPHRIHANPRVIKWHTDWQNWWEEQQLLAQVATDSSWIDDAFMEEHEDGAALHDSHNPEASDPWWDDELLAEIATDTSWVEDLMDSSDDATFFDSYNIEIPEFLVPA